MSDAFDHSSLPDDELLAAEYALGVLSGAERGAAEQRACARPWLCPAGGGMGATACAVGCGDRRRRAAAAGLGPDCGRPARANARQRPVAKPRLLARTAPCDRRPSPPPVLRRSSISAALTQPQPLVATIEGDGHRHFVATIDTRRGTVAVVPAAFSADATRVPELWLIPARWQATPGGSPACRPDGHSRRFPPILPPWQRATPCWRFRLSRPAARPPGCRPAR